MVAFSRPKEPHSFAHDLPGLQRNSCIDAYRGLFRPTDSTQLLVEGSVWYLYSQCAIREILKVRPDARFIVMLRHPVHMLESLHRQLRNALDEDVVDFETAWHLSDARARGDQVPKGCRAPATLIYTRTAAFGEMLERMFSLVDRNRCLVLFQEEMHTDTGRVYRRVLDFLGLDDDGRTAFPRFNEAAEPRSRAIHYVVSRGGAAREVVSKPLKRLLGVKSLGLLQMAKRLNDTKIEKPQIPQHLFNEIAEHYREDMKKLSQILKLDLHASYGWPNIQPERRHRPLPSYHGAALSG